MPRFYRHSRSRLPVAVALVLALLTAGALLAQDTVTSSQTTGGIPAGPISEQPAVTATPDPLIENIAATATEIALTLEAAEARVTQSVLTAEAILATAEMAASATIAATSMPAATIVPAGPLTETLVRADAGFSISYPQGWAALSESSFGEPNILSNSPNPLASEGMSQFNTLRAAELMILFTVPADLNRFYRLGLEADPEELLQAALNDAGFIEVTATPYERLAVPAAIAELPNDLIRNLSFGATGVAITAQYPGIGTLAFIVLSGSPFDEQEGLVIEILNSVRSLDEQAAIVLPTVAVPTVAIPTIEAPTVVIASGETAATEIAATLMAEGTLEALATISALATEGAAPQATPTPTPTDEGAWAGPLTEILVRSDAGFSIRYPQGWLAMPQSEFEEESNMIASSAAATEQEEGRFINITAGDVVILFSIPEDTNRFSGLGLDADPVELLQVALSDAGYTEVDVEMYEQLSVPAAIAGPLEALAREASPGAFATTIAVQYPEIGTMGFIVLSGEPFAEVEAIVIAILDSVQALEAE